MVEAKQIDCLAGLSELAEGSVSVVVTSPPYNIGMCYSGYDDHREDYGLWMSKVFTGVLRVLTEDGHFFLQVGNTSRQPHLSRWLLGLALDSGFVLQNEIVWVKSLHIEASTNGAGGSYGHYMPLNSDRYLNKTHEFILHLTRTGSAAINNMGPGVGVPYVDKRSSQRYHHRRTLRCRGNVWFIPHETRNTHRTREDHPAVFPVRLPELCIQLSGCPRGSLVVDPFCGSGSTLVACQRTGMRGLGFDVSKVYVKVANQRILLPTDERPLMKSPLSTTSGCSHQTVSCVG